MVMNFVTTTIIEQLGGNKFIAMTGSKHFFYNDNSVSFKIAKSNGINTVKIVLDANDTYTMMFYRIIGAKMTLVAEVAGVYADQLQTIFTEKTGLFTSL